MSKNLRTSEYTLIYLKMIMVLLFFFLMNKPGLKNKKKF